MTSQVLSNRHLLQPLVADEIINATHADLLMGLLLTVLCLVFSHYCFFVFYLIVLIIAALEVAFLKGGMEMF